MDLGLTDDVDFLSEKSDSKQTARRLASSGGVGLFVYFEVDITLNGTLATGMPKRGCKTGEQTGKKARLDKAHDHNSYATVQTLGRLTSFCSAATPGSWSLPGGCSMEADVDCFDEPFWLLKTAPKLLPKNFGRWSRLAHAVQSPSSGESAKAKSPTARAGQAGLNR